jgi:hypothetical protein
MAALFVAGTLIHMADGSVKNIEDIVIGESVLVQNDTTFNNASVVVTESGPSNHLGTSIKAITFGDGTQTVSRSDSQYLVDGKGLVSVENLVVGDQFRSYWGDLLAVTAIDDITADQGLFEDTYCGLYQFEPRSSSQFICVDGVLVSNAE